VSPDRVLLACAIILANLTLFAFAQSPAVRAVPLDDPFAAARPAPNYAEPRAWAAWPGRPSGADVVPLGASIVDPRKTQNVDVFFVHPTTYLSSVVGNARFDEPGLPMAAVDSTVLRFQASAFNACCRIFVPRYRQAAVVAFVQHGADSEAAIDLAYADVRRAFEYYLAHENGGRPFIIAGHSQGSLHAMRLLQEFVAGTPLHQQLVAAYVVGYSIPEEIERAGLPICRDASQTGCLVDWATIRRGETGRPGRALIWLDGHYEPVGDREIVCVNPLSWTPGGAAPAQANLGAVPHVWPRQPMPAAIPGLTGATCEAGLLGIDVPLHASAGFSDVLTLFGSYHDFDYNLFYMNIRQNAVERVAAYLGERRL
jgi:hypothetical protein